MKITNLLQINFKKLGQYKLKAMFLIFPIAVLMTLTIIISSQVANFQNAANQTIFGTIENQSTLINLTKTVSFQAPQGGPGAGGTQKSFFDSNNQFTSSDIQKITQIANVTSASINSQVPIQKAVTTDLFSGSNYNLQNLVEIDPKSASLYTDENFDYTDGQTVIPIVLNASTFQTQYEDWGGKTEVDVTFNRGSRPNGKPDTNTPPENNTPIKVKKIDFNKQDLLGKTFTASFGGLDNIQDFKIEQASGSLKFVKLTDEEIATKESERKTAISKYWDYDKVSKPVTYTFKVVGVIESEADSKTYIPAAFADSLMKNYIQNQLDARNATAIPTSDLNSTYRGMTYDGTELSSGGFGGNITVKGGGGAVGGGAVFFGGPGGGNNGNTNSYTIPGLVIKLSEDGSQNVDGVVTDTDVYKNSVKKGQSISIKINSVYDREQVVKDLNSAGFAYTDVNNLDVFNNLRNSLNSISTWFTIAFIALSIAVIIFTMSKFVSESRKEIGIFRAIGMKKLDIVLLFTSQAILYTAIGYLVGVIAGYLLNIISAGAMKNWFDSLVLKTVKETYGVVNNIDGSVFTNISWQTIGYYSLGLLIITLIISLIPAMRASSVSPVEAIKGE